ncbi:MAG: hypothetical protein A3C27_00125 [Candidatus Levybacteria bacterium RIFCSPHIGHO2_02_FULL_39_36]|nr:MAG: hypothetical protein A3C27_00125 [Candidatus Levybacteria bacterium RIFCSPHIGHO2_02_FULL_39_36]OGH45378.1 MAG: hypothetical protein A3H82_02170 [Candidatus Levybacteria bacterium RIFCSPLOWO2_02_FULL_39_26]OGH48494.1 MAG: hypothetical protein A3G66_03020 [Candidatus Levybacteria bacterium RIFCSPLOWO2_12_FULL_39_17]
MKTNKNILNKVPLDEAVELLKKLVSIKTVNPPGKEIVLKPIIVEAAKKIDGKLEIVQGAKGRANFIIKIGEGFPSIGFFPHLDTVPAGDGWKTDPFKPVIKGGKLYARGSVDSKGNYASSWAAIRTFLDRNKKFKGTIYLVGFADEETGSDLGSHYLLKKGFRVDYAIVPDGGFIDKIITGEKGVIRLRFKSFGKQAHGSAPERGINAVENLIKALHKFTEIRFEELSFHEAFDGITKNIGTIKGGHAVNIVPAYAEAEIDIRIPLGVTKKQILDLIKKAMKELTLEQKKKGVKIEIEETLSLDPHLTESDSILIKAFMDSSRELGLKMRSGTMGGITDAKPLSFAEIETLVHSLDDGSHSAHNANEYVKLENIRIAAALYCLTLERILEKKQENH